MKVSVKSAVRIRPFISTDQPNDVLCVSALPHLNQIVLSGQSCFTVDNALPVNYNQSQVFEVSVQPMVRYILQGYDTSVMVYGQINSGKTYTIFGPGLHCAFSEVDYGIIPRATREIFNQLMHGTRRYKVKITFIEIFGESIRDLLGSSQVKPVLEEKNGRTSVCHLNEIECCSVSEVFNWLHIGMSSRQVSENAVNARSSCGHSVFTLFLEQEWVSNGVQQHIHSQAQFTDLAGFNNVFLNIALETPDMQRLHYDNGLLALENMILALSEPGCEYASVVYMNTVLTRILKNSCGGTAITLFICCVSPVSLDISETLHSLHLAVHIRNVKNVLRMNFCNNTSAFCINSSEKEAAEEKAVVPEKLNTDVFGLSFAASQWLKLVASAENLFNELATSASLSAEMKDQIEHWLCLKQECEECIESDHGLSDSVSESRLLYRIDELTEPEDRNSSVVDEPHSISSECSSSAVMCNSLLGSNVGFPDFLEKLDGCIRLFKDETDKNVQMVEEKFVLENCSVQDSNLNGDSLLKNSLRNSLNINDGESDQQECDSCRGIPPKHLSARRNSVCHVANSPGVMVSELQFNEISEVKEAEIANDHVEENSGKSLATILQSTDLPSLLKQLNLMVAENGDKQSKFQQVIIELEVSLKGIEELKQCILMKEQLIGNLIKNELSMSLKHYVSEYLKMDSHLVCAENSVHSVGADKNKNQENPEEDDGPLKQSSLCCEKCLKGTKDSTVGGTDIILECETATQEMAELKLELQKELKHKHELEKEIAADKEKIKDLQEKYHQQEIKMVENNPLKQLQWIQEEEMRLMNIQKSALHLHEELLKQQSLLEKREAFLKEKICQEKLKSKDETDMNARISHLAHILKEKSDHLEVTSDKDEKEALRHEIRNLRKTRDCLVEQLCSLDEKFQKDKVLTTTEERKLLECDEAIEAIDAAIEYKNEMLCGRKDHEHLGLGQRERNEELLLARLMKLSPVEIRSLLCKYFKKVIDLRESGRKMEVQLTELDMQTDAQTWKIHALSSALQQARVDAERQIITLQKEHEEKMHLVLRHFAEESSSSSEVESVMRHYSSDILANLNKYKHENKNLRRRIQEMEAVIHMSNLGGDESRCPSPVTIPRRNLKQLQGTLAPYTTKVTRQKNKLIIQQQTKQSSQKK